MEKMDIIFRNFHSAGMYWSVNLFMQAYSNIQGWSCKYLINFIHDNNSFTNPHSLVSKIVPTKDVERGISWGFWKSPKLLVTAALKASIPYCIIIGWGKYWQKVYLEGMVGKYLANLNLNKTICILICIETKWPGSWFIMAILGCRSLVLDKWQ